ncbi:MAG: CoA-binding protein [Marinilabiliales bacterium]|nr:MAG: CoA-binding protein [Marinilabiliales bacterium]
MIHVVLGASTNERRYSYRATEALSKNGYRVLPVGIRSGDINGEKIVKEFPLMIEIDTIAMYLSEDNQAKYEDLILQNLPRRVVFNPGTHNAEFQKTLMQKGVEVLNDCVLVMLSNGRY